MKKLIALIFIIFFCFQITVSAQSMSDMKMFMVEKLTINKDNAPVTNADIYAFNQTRTTDGKGNAEFENAGEGDATIKVSINGKEYSQKINISSANTTVNMTGAEVSLLNTTNPVQSSNNSIIIFAILLLLIIVAGIVLFKKFENQIRNYSLKRNSNHKIGLALGGITTFVLLAALITQSVFVTDTSKTYNLADNSKAAVLSSIEAPKNIKTFGDDRVATITWDAPDNADSQKIVGYFVQWGLKNGGKLTDSKQTIYNIAQIQPLINGQEYIVQVQSVQGSYTKSFPSSNHCDTPNKNCNPAGQSTYAVANGNLSSPIQSNVIPTSARVDSVRSKSTGFFDDFNDIGAGGFDETKWNTATSSCAGIGTVGSFINSQSHAHTQVESVFCDRSQIANRVRNVFDTTGRSKANPAEIFMDVDGISQPRDIWYVDLIPTDTRKNEIPVDITSHNTADDDVPSDPGRMIRLTQERDTVSFRMYDQNKAPSIVPSTFNCGFKDNGYTDLNNCSPKPIAGMSTLPEPSTENFRAVPNVRRHWIIQISDTQLSLFIDSTLILQANIPSTFKNIYQYDVHSTLFSYNTGKDFEVVEPTTSMLHWDNFGFTGPSPATVVHNYLEGGSTGTTPYMGKGISSASIPAGTRNTVIPIPDQIGSPQQARLMFTMQNFDYSSYSWSSSDKVIVNGVSYPYPNPSNNIQTPIIKQDSHDYISDTITPFSDGIIIRTSDLKQGNNAISLNIGNTDIMDVHIELEYNKTSVPSFTQPRAIFSNLNSYIIPPMATNDSYWFVEQNMGLTNTISTPIPTTPTATLVATTTPIANANCVCGSSNNLCSNSCTFASGNSNAGLSCNSEIGTPTPADKNSYCTREYRTKGDADGDGVINSLDYIYYVRAVNGGTIPTNINPDFNGDGHISVSDRNIVIQNIQK